MVLVITLYRISPCREFVWFPFYQDVTNEDNAKSIMVDHRKIYTRTVTALLPVRRQPAYTLYTAS